MTVRSGPELVAGLPAGRALVALAGACGQRSAGLWTTAEDPRLAGLIRTALDEVWRTVESGEPPAEDRGAVLLEELHEDCNFGEFHSERLNALVAVAAAAAAARAAGDDPAARESVEEALWAEIQIVKGLFCRQRGTYIGATEDVSVARELRWQEDDVTALAAGPTVALGRAKALLR